MDSFTENVLTRARQRQKELRVGSEEELAPLHEAESRDNKTSSEPNLTQMNINSRLKAEKENSSEGNLSKFSRQNSKTRVSSEMISSPQSQFKTLNIQNDNFNMEIKVTSSDDVRVEVQIEEHSSDDGQLGGLRQDAKNRLNRLGKLYAGGEDAGISSPIHRTEAKFYAENVEDTANINVKQEETQHLINKSRKGLSKLTDLANNINQWEDDLSTPRKEVKEKPAVKKSLKMPAPQPPAAVPKTSPTKAVLKKKAPAPPVNKIESPKKVQPSETPNKGTKQLEWDKTVLNNLESQGFTRTSSSSRLVYNYNSQDKNKENKPNLATKTQAIIEEEEEEDNNETEPETKPEPPKPNQDNKINKLNKNIFPGVHTASVISPRSPTKLRTPAIADKAAIFESSSPTKAAHKDPALLSVSERKALFEKNKGAALVPKAAFAMSAPVKSETPKAVAKPLTPIVEIVKTFKAPEVVKSITPQAAGIASKMAALLEKKTTISQEQIESKIREQKQKEMNMLLNRFNKNKELNHDLIEVVEEESDLEDADETTAMLVNEKTPRIVTKTTAVPQPPPPPPVTEGEKRRNGGKRCGKADSPKVAAVLNDVKRIKVSPQKAGRLYPSLSDIEAVTETETEEATPSNSSFGESIPDSDDGNTSFGRDILQAVCKNHSPQKRSLVSETTESDLSDILEDMDDDYIDEALSYNASDSNGPTPPKHGRQSPSLNASHHSESFNYKNFSSKSQFKSPMKTVCASPRNSGDLPAFVVDGDSVLPLKHTVSIYRKQQTQISTTPIRQIFRPKIVEESSKSVSDNHELVLAKIRELHDEVNLQEKIISQTSQALNLCNCTPEFMGSTEQVEAEKVLLVSTHRRQAAQHELQRLQVEDKLRPQGRHSKNVPLEKGTLTISRIVLPLKYKYVTALAAAGGKGHHVVCLIKCGEQVVPTKLVSTIASNSKNPDTELQIPGTISLNNIYSDFTITFEVYCLQAQEEILPHEVKYHINSKKPNIKLTPKKSKDSRLVRPIKESPAGPQAVRSPTFALMGYVVFSVQAINKKHWTLNNTPSMSPLEGSVEMRIDCELNVSVEHRGFLTMFEDVSGFGAWHRRWCLLKGDCLSYWKYPDDERKVPPIDTISLKNCVTKHVGPVSREICARLHTILLERERIAYPQDKDTLVMVCKGDKTIIRHLLSADTKEERIEWCDKLNAALTALHMWGNSKQ